MLTDIDCGALLHLSAKGVDLHQRPAILTGPWYQSLPDFDFVSESPLVLLLDWIDLSVLTFAWLPIHPLPYTVLSCLGTWQPTGILLFSLQTQYISVL